MVLVLTCAVIASAVAVGATIFSIGALHHIYFDRRNLPEVGPFTRFEFPTIGHVYDSNRRGGIVGPAPAFPNQMEQRITRYLQGDVPALAIDRVLVGAATGAP